MQLRNGKKHLWKIFRHYSVVALGCVSLLTGCFDAGEERAELDAAMASLDGSNAADTSDTSDTSMPEDATTDDTTRPDDADMPLDAGEPDVVADVCTPSVDGELCDGVDNDCDGEIDNGFQSGECTVGVGACEATGEYECVDEQTAGCNATPGTPSDEQCGDAIDNDCDGETDEDDAVDAARWFADADGDGFGDPNSSVRTCEQPAGYVSDDTDCDDTDPSVYQALTGYLDQDGDGYTSGGQTLCTDGSVPSGYLASENAGDCDDAQAAVNPGADEVCDNGTDNDCDGQADDSSAADATTWFIDCDGDGFSADSAGSRRSCTTPTAPTGCTSSNAGWTDVRPSGSGATTDCNDDVADAFPGQTAWFDQPMGSNPHGAQIADWDYNCDGAFNYRWTNAGASCEQGSVGMCSGSSGWVSQYSYGCGGQGDFELCKTNSELCNGLPCNFSCDDSIVQRVQECH